MTSSLCRLCLLCCCIAFTAPAPAAEVVPPSGEDLLAKCARALEKDGEKKPGTAEGAQCVGFVTGFIEGLGFEALLNGGSGQQLFCAPAGTTTDQMIELYVNHLKKSTTRANRAGILLAEALTQAYPCKK
ncbi:MAG: hypothetical protein KIT73_04600 [Burkholderiales bacterium]|nr:hypothetical protein [Burkholderiales bacterium]